MQVKGVGGQEARIQMLSQLQGSAQTQASEEQREGADERAQEAVQGEGQEGRLLQLYQQQGQGTLIDKMA